MTKTQTVRHKDNGPGTPTGSPGVFTSILCAVDGTNASTAAVRMATALAGPDSHLTLLAATAASGSGPSAIAAISPGRAKRILDRAKNIADQAGVQAGTVVDPGGPPVEVILERASNHDLLVIGAPVSSWLSGMLIASLSSSLGGRVIGGVTAAALSRFTTPMLVVRAPRLLHGRSILVASDGEKGSDRIVELAASLGQSQGAQVTLVNALGAESKMNPRAIQAQARALKRTLPNTGEPRIEPGKASEVILNAAKSTKAAMVVIGSRRLGGVRAFGSVSRRVVHDAPCSVLVVPLSGDPAPRRRRKGGS